MKHVMWSLSAAFVLFLGAGRANADIVVNGGFETGDFTGWTVSGVDPFDVFVSTSMPHSGLFAADLGSVGGIGFLSQTLPTTAGQTYALSYWLANDGFGPVEHFDARINGNVIPGSVLDSPGIDSGFPYRQFTFDFTATGPTTVLSFGERQDPAFLHLDDVSVNAVVVVPEPATLGLLCIGLAGLAGCGWRRRQRAAA
jgi:hypothetical protein